MTDDDRQEVKRIRTRFESALRENKANVSIELVISSAPVRLKRIILRELLSAELEWNLETGPAPSLESYLERFPAEAEIVNEAFDKLAEEIDELRSLDSERETMGETKSVSGPSRGDELSMTFAPRNTRIDSVAESTSSYSSDNANDQKYEIESEIDRGGMGLVLQVKDLSLNRTLAMKVILEKEDLSSESRDDRAAEKLERFIREATITSRLDHPGVVPVHELGIDETGRSFFTMKLVQGKTLKKVYRDLKKGRGAWTRARVIEILVRVCDTIAFAHSKGIIHRDLKPANIMVGEFGETYVMDWGLAKVLHEEEGSSSLPVSPIKSGILVDSSATMHGSVIGTPYYMSPEQAAGRIEYLDERSDIYSIGALLYQMLSGHKPYDEYKSSMEIVSSVCARAPVAISDHTRKAPVELVAIADKAMQRDRADRYASATEIADDLRAFLDNRVVAAYRTGLVAKFEKWLFRNRIIFGTVLLLLIASLGVITLLQHRNNIEVSQKNTELDGKSRKLEESLAAEKDANRKEQAANDRLWGRKLVFDANNILETTADATLASLLAIEAQESYKYVSVETRSAIYASASKLSESLILRGHRKGVRKAVFSPDGRRIVTISSDGTGVVWDATTGKKISLIINKHGAEFKCVVFSKDGNQILASGNDGTIGIWETQTGIRRLAVEVGDTSIQNGNRPDVSIVNFFPDETRVIAATTAGLFLLDSASGELVGTLKTGDDPEYEEVKSLGISPDGTRIIAGTAKGRVFVWDAQEQKLIKSIQARKTETGKVEPVRTVDLNFDGSLFVAVSNLDDGKSKLSARIWHTDSGKIHTEVNLGNGISAAAFHPNRNQLIVAVGDGLNPTIQVWDVDSEKVIATSQRLPAVARLIQFAPDSDVFFAICSNADLSVWELESSPSNQTIIRHVENLVGHDQQELIRSADFDENGSRVVSASDDRTARIWNIDSTRAVPLLGRTTFPGYPPFWVKINAKGNRILLLSTNKRSGNLWSYPDLQLVAKLDLPGGFSNWNFDSAGDFIFAGTNSGACVCWNASDGAFVRKFENIGHLQTASYDSASQRLCLHSNERTSIWNFADGKLEREFEKARGEDHFVHPDGLVILSYSKADSSFNRIDPETGVVTLLPIETIKPVSFSPDGRHFWCRGPLSQGVGEHSFSAKILDARTLTETLMIQDDTGIIRWVKWVYFSPDSSKIRVEHHQMIDDEAVGPAYSIWSTIDGTKVCEFGQYGAQLIAANDDFSRFVLDSKEGIQLLDGINGQPISTLQQSFGKFRNPQFSRDGKYLISESVTETRNSLTGRPESRVAIWDGETGDLLANLPDDKSLFVAGFLPDSKSFLTFSDQNQVQVWPTDIVGETKRRLSRTLSPMEQDAFLAEKTGGPSNDPREDQLSSIEQRVGLLGPIIADRRHEAWDALNDLGAWLRQDPTPEELDAVIECSQTMVSGPYDTDPGILVKIADFYRQRGDGMSAVRYLEQASRHPRAKNFDWNQLAAARQSIAPVIASFRSADSLAEQIPNDGERSKHFAAATAWAKQKNDLHYRYLTAQQHLFIKDRTSASELLKSIVGTSPTEPEPYLLYANCLLEQSNPELAVNVLRRALDIESCRAPEVWKLWLQISFADLGRDPSQLLADLPAPTDNVTTEPRFGDHVKWLLQRLVAGQALRINPGCYTDVRVGVEEWSMDRFFTYGFGFFELDGEVRSFPTPIENTDKDILYQSERFFPERNDLPAGYQIPLPNGIYEVELGFSEIWQEVRSFDVEIENKSILKDYDPAGGKFATAEEFSNEIEVTDGLLNIELKSNNDFPPKISTISVTPISN